MFFSVRELELRKAHFDVSYPPGEIEFSDGNVRQLSPLKAEGSVELLGNTLGEIRVQARRVDVVDELPAAGDQPGILEPGDPMADAPRMVGGRALKFRHGSASLASTWLARSRHRAARGWGFISSRGIYKAIRFLAMNLSACRMNMAGDGEPWRAATRHR